MKHKRTTEMIPEKILIHTKALLFLIICFSQFLALAQEPPKPQIVSVTIVDFHPFITWVPNTINTEAYGIIRREGSSIAVEVAIVPGISSSSYLDQEVIACDKWYEYQVYARNGQQDSDWSDPLRTILLYQPQLHICDNNISLDWTEYINMTPDLLGYQVWVSESGGSFFLLAQVAPDIRTFNHTSLLPNTLYTYKILAVNQDIARTSSSCELSVRSKTYRKPAFTNVLSASVENNDHVQVTWETDPEALVTKYVLERSDGVNFEISGSQPTQFSDTSADFNAQSYDYSVLVFDSCGFQSITSANIGRTILLGWQPGADNLQIDLSWNEYADWTNGVDHYNIYRNADGSFTQIGTTNPGETTFPDNVSSLTDKSGVFTYYVEAVENSGNNLTSKSNQIVVELETKVLAPNAFIPEGLPPDNEFKPSLTFVDQSSYELLIFNKWGQKVFSTKDSKEGWDGKFNGEYVPADAYVYRIRVKSPDGRDFQKQGTVTVIR